MEKAVTILRRQRGHHHRPRPYLYHCHPRHHGSLVFLLAEQTPWRRVGIRQLSTTTTVMATGSAERGASVSANSRNKTKRRKQPAISEASSTTSSRTAMGSLLKLMRDDSDGGDGQQQSGLLLLSNLNGNDKDNDNDVVHDPDVDVDKDEENDDDDDEDGAWATSSSFSRNFSFPYGNIRSAILAGEREKETTHHTTSTPSCQPLASLIDSPPSRMGAPTTASVVATTNSYSSSNSEERLFMEKLGIHRGYSDIEDWYEVHKRVIVQYGGARLLARHGGSTLALVQSAFPDHEWLPWLFKKVPQRYWHNMNNQREYVAWLAAKLKIPTTATTSTSTSTTSLASTTQSMRLLGELSTTKSKTKTIARTTLMPEPALDLSGWYQVTNQIVHDAGGASLLQRYKGSLGALLAAVYPSHHWRPWLFSQLPANYWHSLAHRKAFFDHIAVDLGFGKYIHKNTATDTRTDEGQGQQAQTQVGVEIEIDMNGWYSVNPGDVTSAGGDGVLAHFNHSLVKALLETYPDHTWHLWRFSHPVPPHYWEATENVKQFLDWLYQQLQFKSMEDWYGLKRSDVRRLGGGALLYVGPLPQPTILTSNKKGESKEDKKMTRISPTTRPVPRYTSLQSLLQVVYPDHTWVPWKFDMMSRKTEWTDQQVSAFMIQLGESLGKPTQPQPGDEWYSITHSQIISHGGERMLRQRFDGDIVQALRVAFPDHVWEDWRFIRPKGITANSNTATTTTFTTSNKEHEPTSTLNKDNKINPALSWSMTQLQSVQSYLVDKLHIRSLSDWYGVSATQRRRYMPITTTASSPASSVITMAIMLKRLYPDHPWQISRFSSPSSTSQISRLFRCTSESDFFVNNTNVKTWYVPKGEGKTAAISFDIYVPDVNVAIVLDHDKAYLDMMGASALLSPSATPFRDEAMQWCTKLGIRLVIIPPQWDGNQAFFDKCVQQSIGDHKGSKQDGNDANVRCTQNHNK